MDLEQCDIESRIPYSDGLDGFYYYTNTFFYDLDNPPDDNPSYYWCAVALLEGCYSCVDICGLKRTAPPGSGIFVGGGDSPPQPGALSFTGGYSPFDIVRLHFYAGGKYVGYKLWRMPVVNEAMDGGNIEPSVVGYLEGQIVPHLLHAKITTHTGTPVDEIRVMPKIHQWSFRHGTKRRARRVLIFP